VPVVPSVKSIPKNVASSGTGACAARDPAPWTAANGRPARSQKTRLHRGVATDVISATSSLRLRHTLST
jgi:hypothetical protein